MAFCHGAQEGQAFWHIHLDNFACGQRVKAGMTETAGGHLHRQAEEGWNSTQTKALTPATADERTWRNDGR